MFRLNTVSSLKAIIGHMTHFCPRCTAPHPSLNLDPLHGDGDAIIWNQWELLGSCSTNSTLSAWRQQPPWQLRSLISEKGKNAAGRFPADVVFHHMQRDCWLTITKSDSSLSQRQQQCCLGWGDGTPDFLCGRQEPFNHRYSELSEKACLYCSI